MLYKSLKNFKYKVSFKEAVLTGQSPEKGLYFPENIPVLKKKIIKNISNYDEHHLMMEVIQPFIGNEIPHRELLNIISNTVNFKININNIYENIYSLELFLGPTMAFKDIGVKFMSGCIKYFCKELNKNIIILTATSGDTGAAVANAFNKIDGVKVVILYPSSKISILQEKQITTLGNNILALEIKGNFDDCQMLVKKAFSDNQIRENLFITSANSINIARLLSQIFYYFMCYKLLFPIHSHSNDKLIISIPSGNFGNICAGLIAFKMGLPVKQFIAATNINDTIPRLLKTGIYNPFPTQETISNAMDISDPSNFSRIMYMFKNVNNIKKLVSAYSFSDKETFEIIKSIWANYKYIMDPHGAIGYLGLKQFLKKKNNTKNIFLSTAAPVKFLDKISKGIDQKISLEKKVIKLLKKEKKSIQLSNKYDTFQKWLLNLD
ncbi:threonine synthase [Candidatus Karelsulcia muelleri]|uniref:threonine synthase n=1 Tax=Candidatus Karelsulcia muelleri TaxID=336810 RepID=UPI00216ADE46|nr:threonine synthase [Candidatus Karelsulcia muelleri]